jgi:hypothetical protein
MKPDLMKQSPEAAAPSPGDFDLGTWLGRRQAFGMMAGRASAADAECLRYIRDHKLYKSRASNWPEFCARYLGASRTNVDRIIQQLEEFGPEFFQLTQLTRISPEAYRAIAPHVTKDGLRFGSEVIALLPENTEKVSAAVAELRKQSGAGGGAAPRAGFAAVKKCLADVPARLDALRGSLGEDEKAALESLLTRISVSAMMAGVRMR